MARSPLYELLLTRPLRVARRVAIAIAGMTVLGMGLAMVVLPGPAILVIPAGLAILATEFVWAKRLLHRIRERAARVASAVRGRKAAVEEL